VKPPPLLSSGVVNTNCAADGADVGAVAQPMHLHMRVDTVIYSNVALAVNGDARVMAELCVA